MAKTITTLWMPIFMSIFMVIVALNNSVLTRSTPTTESMIR